jgi:hypothetical protein
MSQISEKQRFDQKWLFILLLAILCMGLFFLVKDTMVDEKYTVNTILPPAIIVSIFILFRVASFEYTINPDEIRYRFFPFQLRYRKIKAGEVKKITVSTYDPFSEQGGWGIRKIKDGWAYTTSGNKGIDISLLNGKRVFFGTKQDLDSLRSKIKEMNYPV